MKKILFCLQTMVRGGVEKELVTILKRFDRENYELNVLLFYETNKAVQATIPKDIPVTVLNIDREHYCSSAWGTVKALIKKKEFGEAIRVAFNRFVRNIPVMVSLDLKDISDFESTYDIAVCYHMHSPLVLRYVAEKVTAEKKVAWIHNDFATTGFNISKYSKTLAKYDTFVSVSKQLENEFCALCPDFSERSKTVLNIIDRDGIIEKSNEKMYEAFEKDSRFKIVTVGRLATQKGYDLAINAAKILKLRGMQFAWYAIGGGDLLGEFEALAKENGLNNEFIFLGEQSNPYPYMKNCNLYVQPSRHEGFAVTLLEARALEKAIVCTDFAGASEQIDSGVNGIILEDFECETIANAIYDLYINPYKINDIENALKGKDVQDGWADIEEVFSD